jgi:arsenate reductase
MSHYGMIGLNAALRGHLSNEPVLLYCDVVTRSLQELSMSEFTIYHNPRCSKSRNTLALLQENGIEPEIVLYLENRLDEEQLCGLLEKLGMSAGQLVRRGEEAYKASDLGAGSTDEEIIAAMAAHPKLIERPIVVRGERAVLGRPPENVLELIA